MPIPQLSLVYGQSQRGTQGVARSGAVCPAGRMAGPCLSRCKETPQPLTKAAVGPKEPGGAAASPGGRITGAPVETPTQQLTARPEPPRRAPCGVRGQLPGSGGSQSPSPPAITPADPAGGRGSTHVAGSWRRGSLGRTHRPPRRGCMPGSRQGTGTAAHSAPRRCQVGRLGEAAGVSPGPAWRRHPPSSRAPSCGQSSGAQPRSACDLNCPQACPCQAPTLLTAGPCEARGTVTLPSDVVAGGTRVALAALGTGLSKPAGWAGCREARGGGGEPWSGGGGPRGSPSEGPAPPWAPAELGAHRSHTAGPSTLQGRGRPR